MFTQRSLADTSYPYVFVDATYCKARVGKRVVSQAIVVAIWVAADGHRQVLGFQLGDTESEPFWTEFFRDLKQRGLSGVQLVISDAHAGLISAIQVGFQGAAWQRCRVHFMRNMLARVTKVADPMVAAIIRTNVVGTFPNPEALLRLTGHVLIEQHDEWDAADRRYFSDASMKLLTPGPEEVILTSLEAA